MAGESSRSVWTWEQNKLFERAIAYHWEDNVADKWERIASYVPGKSMVDILRHFEMLVDDVNAIDMDLVQIPRYISSHSDGLSSRGGGEAITGKKGESSKSSRADQERRKGIAWTEDEHRSFLYGLERYGKGDWRSISRNSVLSRTPTQVASHAQKYFIRLNSNKDRKRSSIHDITIVNSGDISVSEGPITGQTNVSAIWGSSETPTVGGISIYGSRTIGQPIGGPLLSTVGTSVNVPQSHLAYPMHGLRHPDAPMNMSLMTYLHPPVATSQFPLTYPIHGPRRPGAPMNMSLMTYLHPT